MHPDYTILVFTVLAALILDFCNGWHDCANAVATVIATRVMHPMAAIFASAILNFAGALISTKVAKAVGGDIIDPMMVQKDVYIMLAAMSAGIIWLIWTQLAGMPVSSSHSLIGGLIGSAVAIHGFDVLRWVGITKILIAMLLSPLLGLFIGFIVLKIFYWFSVGKRPNRVSRFFARLQLLSSAAMSVMHGQNDAQKAMGIITLTLFAAGLTGETDFNKVNVPIWVMLSCGLAMAAGTAIGGWRVIRTLGSLSHLRPIEGSAAEFSAAAVLEGAARLGIPVSTTHTITGSILGVGSARRMKGVRWSLANKVIYAWIFTLPICAALGAVVAKLLGTFLD